MKVEAVIFDLDGTLADSLVDIAEAMNRALRRRGLKTHPLQTYREFVGEGVAQLVRRAAELDRMADAAAERARVQLTADFREYYGAHQLDHTVPYPGVVELLDELSRRRLPMSVLSNKPDRATRRIVAALFGKVAFTDVRGQRPGVPRKPDPTAALELASAMNVSAESCALVGDTRTDMETARRGALLAVGVLWGFRGRGELVSHGAQRLLREPWDLVSLLS